MRTAYAGVLITLLLLLIPQALATGCSPDCNNIVSITKDTTTTTIQSGNTLTYTILVTGEANSVHISDSLSNQQTLAGTNGASITRQGIPIVSITGSGETSGTFYNGGILINNFQGTATITYQVEPQSTNIGSVTNVARATVLNTIKEDRRTVTIIPYNENNNDDPITTGDITITKTSSKNIAEDGDIITYTVLVQGSSNSVEITDDLSTQYSIEGNNGVTLTRYGTPNVDTNSGNIGGNFFNGGTFLSNFQGTATITYQATVGAGSEDTTITNNVRAIYGTTIKTASDELTVLANEEPVITEPAKFTIVKGITNRLPRDGEIIGYTITVQNTGETEGTVRIIDDIGENYGRLTGDHGGTITFTGNQQVTGRANGRTFYVQQSGSIASPGGIRLESIPPQGIVTISYQTLVDSSDLGTGVESAITNTARIATSTGEAVSARAILKGPTTTTTSTTTSDKVPQLLPIPGQVLTCGGSFPLLDIDDFVVDDAYINDYDVSISGNYRLQASIDRATNVITVTDPVQLGPVTETITVTLIDEKQRRTSRTVQYRVLDSFRDTPLLAGIPDQIIESDENFNTFKLEDYVQIGDAGELDFYAVGSELLDVVILDDSTVDIDFEEELFDYPDVGQISEVITFGVIGCREAEDVAVFTIINEDLDDLRDPGPFRPIGPGGIGNPAGGTCAIKIGAKLYDDYDCDAIIDEDDNCPFASNKDQRDSDRNGLGDACDIVMSCSLASSATLSGGKTAVVDVQISNNANKDYNGVRVQASIPGLGVHEAFTLSNLGANSAEFVALRLRLPACSLEGSYRVDCSAIGGGFSAEDSFSTRVVESNACVPDDGSSSAEFFQVQDVIRGSEYGGAFPITLSNFNDVQQTYMLTAEGVLPWGDYVFESGSVVVVPAGQRINTNLRVYSNEDTPFGEYPFRVTVASGNDQQDVFLVANIVPDVQNSNSVVDAFSVTELLWILLIVIILGVVIVWVLVSRKNE